MTFKPRQGFENPADVEPNTEALIRAYELLREESWQPTVENKYDFLATDHTLQAHGFSEQEFNRQLNWIEDRFGISEDNREFNLEIHSMDA